MNKTVIINIIVALILGALFTFYREHKSATDNVIEVGGRLSNFYHSENPSTFLRDITNFYWKEVCLDLADDAGPHKAWHMIFKTGVGNGNINITLETPYNLKYFNSADTQCFDANALLHKELQYNTEGQVVAIQVWITQR